MTTPSGRISSRHPLFVAHLRPSLDGAATAMGVADHLITAQTTQQFIDRHAERLAVDIPQGDIDRADRRRQRMGAGEKAAAEHDLPQMLFPGRVLADEPRLERVDRLQHGQLAPRESTFTNTVDAFVCFNFDDQIVPTAAPDGEYFDVGNGHGKW